MNKYAYSGPVLIFDLVATRSWKGETMAPTEKKARSNLAYQFKKQYGKTPDVKITLPGKLTVVE
jgi:hypothetical protein